jgi:hypothetical protein
VSESQSSRIHGPNGDFVASVEMAQRDAEAARLRSKGWGYQKIADHFGIAVSTAHEAVEKALTAVRAEGGELVQKVELERLDEMQRQVMAILDRDHVTISHGRVVRRRSRAQDGQWIPLRDSLGEIMTDSQGHPLYEEEEVPDDSVVLQAVDRLVKISESRRKLLGVDAAQKLDVGGQITYRVQGVSDDDL